MTHTTIDIVTANALRDRPQQTFLRGLNKMWHEWRPDVICFQEGMDYINTLQGFANTHDLDLCVPARRTSAANNPILTKRSVIDVDEVRIDIVHPGVKGQFPPRNITTVKGRLKFDRSPIWIDNTHVNSHIDVKNAERLPRYAMSLDHLETMAQKVQKHKRSNNLAFWSGDFNIDWERDEKRQQDGFPHDIFRPAGLVPVWWEKDVEYQNTKGSRCIDAVGRHRGDARTHYVSHDRLAWGSDHLALKVRYLIRKRG